MSSDVRSTAHDPSGRALAAVSDLVTEADASGDALLAGVRGVVDRSTGRLFEHFLEHVLLAAFPVTVLDVSGLRVLSARGARALAQLHEEILIAGRELHVVCHEGGPREVLDAVGIDHHRGGLRAVAPPGARTTDPGPAATALDQVFRSQRV